MLRNLEEDIIIACAVAVLRMITCRKKKLPEIRVNSYLQGRREKGRFAKDFEDMMSNEKVFSENFHMGVATFKELFNLIEPELQPIKNTRPGDNITALEKFAVFLEYLTSGSIQRHIASVYRISKQYFGTILDEVCNAICKVLKQEIPELNRTEFVRIANEFNAQWNLPNCVGAIDGKHVSIKCPKNAGTLFYNYKGFHSIVLMAIADANYKFLYLDVGAYGSEGDANVYAATRLWKEVLKDLFQFPEDMIVGRDKLPYFFVADDAFPLHKRIVKPYVPRKPKKLTEAERIANYRISRARRCIENAFGILSSKWLCMARTMFCNPERAQKITTACCYLHNYMLNKSKASYCPPKYTDYYDENGFLVEGEWRRLIPEQIVQISYTLPPHAGRPSNIGKYVRDKLKDYFLSDFGCVP